MYTSFLWAAESFEVDVKFGHEGALPIAAGLGTGLLYKSTTGIRGASLAGAIGVVTSLGVWYGGTYLYDELYHKRGRY